MTSAKASHPIAGNPPSIMSGEQQPFHHLFETFGKLPVAHSDAVNMAAYKALRARLDVPASQSGHCILLKAPRAGHGKTHLLTRLQHELGGTHEFIPLHAVGGSRIDALTVLSDTLRRLVRGLPAAGGLTVLDLVARRLFSSALQPLVISGEVPCQDREGALAALHSRPIETFDFHHPAAVTAHWARENFELLGPRLAIGLSQANNLPLREVSFWVDVMFRFSATPVDSPVRVRALTSSILDDASVEAVAYERLVALLGLMGSLMRVVLVADELEGFSSDETAALRFASFLGSLRQSVEKADVILSVNQDVWESAFLPRLSGGLADRLSEITIELEPLNREGMLAIIESRSPGMGEEILGAFGEAGLPTHARGLIKKAAESWGMETTVTRREAPDDAAAFVPPIAEPVLEDAIVVDFPPALPEEPADVFVAPPAPLHETPPKLPDPPDAPTRFSPEAAIAAFRAATEDVEDPFSAPLEPAAWEDPQPWAPPVVQEYVPQQFEATDSPFQPAFEPAPPQDSPFQAVYEPESAVQAFQVAPEPPASEQAADDSVSTDRVDELLRQFRERYGKS